MQLAISSLPTRPVTSLPVELVERKGLGHPDTLCDAIAERASASYSRYCLETFGAIAHHWFDKVMLIGGEADFDFGHGEITHPFIVIFAGKAALAVGDVQIPVVEILTEAARSVLASTLYGFDAERHLRVEVRVADFRGPGQKPSRYRPTSPDDLALVDSGPRVANDACICTGFAPLSTLEQLVLGVEKLVTSAPFKSQNPDTGTDVKVIGMRAKDAYTLRVNLPFIASLIPSRRHYLDRVEQVESQLAEYAAVLAGRSVELEINPERKSRSYLTVTGTVADTGDIGVVGRGNRANGLITPMRCMSIEASAGKNPVDHSGKVYTELCRQIASSVSDLTDAETEVFIATVKERPLTDPELVFVMTGSEDRMDAQRESAVRALVTDKLSSIHALTRGFLDGTTLW